jgi:protease YdgD
MMPMTWIGRFILAIALLGQPAIAQDSRLEKLDTWGRNRGWEGVGLLNIDNQATCTGTMIRPDLVLTAAHCLFDDATGTPLDPRKVEFRAGWRDGQSVARRFGKAALVHPKFQGGDDATLTTDQIRNDIALLQLADPIQSSHADPFRSDRGITPGDNVSVVSYGQGRNDAPSRQRVCEVLEYRGGVAALSCDAVPGSSGAPVFALRDGHPRVVSVVSAIGRYQGRDVSYGMDLDVPLAELLRDFYAGRGVFPVANIAAKRIVVGQDRAGSGTANNAQTGARFLRP